MARVHLDAASGRELRPNAARALTDALELGPGDPARQHAEGRLARDLLDRATATTAELLGADERDVVWTSGGTEAVTTAVLGPLRAARARGDLRRRRLVVGAVEHSAVLRTARRAAADGLADLTELPVDRAGAVDPAAVEDAVDDTVVGVHLQHANHEVGTLQPTHEAGSVCRRVGALLHVDACQTVGQLGVTLEQVGADLLSLSAAKFGGPAGVGALVAGPRARLAPLLVGDARQRGHRAGTLPIAAIASAAVALDESVASQQQQTSAREPVRRFLRDRLAGVPDAQVHGRLAEAHPGIVAASFLYVAGDALVTALDERGWAVSSGSSCAVDGGEPSHVLVAMGALTHGHLRASFTETFDLDTARQFADDVAEVVDELRTTTGRGSRS